MRRVIFNCFFLFCFASYFAQVPTSGLVGAWVFSGNANDVSGSGNHGTVYGATLTTDRCGNVNSAYSFNGSTNYIQTLFAGPTGSVSRSVSFWARTSNTNLMTTFAYGNSSGGLAYAIQYNYNCSGVGIDVNNQALTRGNSCVHNNSWHHIVAVLNSTVSTQLGGVLFYVDGILQPTISCTVSGTTQTINTGSLYPISLGRIHDASSRFFSGDLDDVYLYNRVLSVAEIQQLYQACTPPVIGNTQPCVGNLTTYSVAPVAGASAYSWTLPSGWSGTSVTNSIQVNPGSGGGLIQVTATNACGGNYLASTTVSASLASVTLSASSNTICSGQTVSLTANSAVTYTWLPGAITSSNIVVSPSTSVIYTLLTGCSSNPTIAVNVDPIPVLSIVSTTNSICSGASSSYTFTGASVYSLNSIPVSGSTIALSPTTSTAYTLTGASNFGCSSSQTFSLLVSSLPAIAISANPSTFCAGTTLTLTASGATSYTWIPTLLSGSTVVVSPTSSIIYTVLGQMNGCQSSSTIAFNNLLTVNLVSGGNIDCLNSTIQLSLSANSSLNSILWSGPGIVSSNFVPIVLVNSAGLYSVIVTNSLTGCSASQTINVTSSVGPLTLNIIPSTSYVCFPGNTVQLLANTSANYTWFPSNSVFPPNGAFVSVNPTATTTYSLVGVLGACSGSTSITITVQPLPELITGSVNPVVCSGDATLLSFSGATNYTWSPGSFFGAQITIFPQTSVVYTVTGSNGFCQSTKEVSVTVNPAPDLVLSALKPFICEGESNIISAYGAQSYTWQPQVGFDSVLTVKPAASSVYTVSGKNIFNCVSTSTILVDVRSLPLVRFDSSSITICSGESPVFKYSGAESYTITPEIVFPDSTLSYFLFGESNSCYSSDTIKVIVRNCDALTPVDEEFFIPQGFSPDGDGVNDYFVIKGLAGKVVHLTVFNRWGNEVYIKDNYDNSWSGRANTKGLFIDDNKLPEGTYFYVLRFNSSDEKPIRGFLVLRY